MAAELKVQAGTEALAELLKHKVKALCDNKTVIMVTSDETPIQGFEKIVDNRVLSAPVYDKKKHEWVGFLDTRDLVAFVVFLADEKEKRDANLKSLFTAASTMYQCPLEGITTTYLARRNKFIPVRMEDSLIKCVELLSQKNIHRVPVLDEHNRVVDIISQSSIVKYLYKHRDQVKETLACTIADAKLGSSPVMQVGVKSTALETLKLMSKYNRSGIPVVNSEGKFVGNTSGSDLKLFVKNPRMDILSKPVMDFLSAIRQAELIAKIRAPTISVTGANTVCHVLSKLDATRIHRLFVVDDEYRPVAVISITDVMKFILSAVKK